MNTPNTQAEPSLLPCPFCGGSALLETQFSKEWAVTCSECDACSNVLFESISEATTAWNRRAPPAPPAAEHYGAIAWIRRHPDGTLTRELLHNDAIEQVRKGSSGWLPLGLLNAPTADVAGLVDDIKSAVDELANGARYPDLHEAIDKLAALAQPKQPDSAAAVLDEIGAALGIGSAVRELDLIRHNLRNLQRRNSCLSAIENTFFMVPDEGDDGEEGETCLLNWGHDPEDYVAAFRSALDVIRPVAERVRQGQPARTAATMTPMHNEDGTLRGYYVRAPEFYCDVERDETGAWSVFFRNHDGKEAYCEQPARVELPPLPQAFDTWRETDDDAGAWGRPDQPIFTADQMRAYARAALAGEKGGA